MDELLGQLQSGGGGNVHDAIKRRFILLHRVHEHIQVGAQAVTSEEAARVEKCVFDIVNAGPPPPLSRCLASISEILCTAAAHQPNIKSLVDCLTAQQTTATKMAALQCLLQVCANPTCASAALSQHDPRCYRRFWDCHFRGPECGVT